MADNRRKVKLPRGKPRALLVRPERIRTPGLHALSGRVDVEGPEGGKGGVRLSVLVNGEEVATATATGGPRTLTAAATVSARRGDYVEVAAALVTELPSWAERWPWLLPVLGQAADWRAVQSRVWVRRVG